MNIKVHTAHKYGINAFRVILIDILGSRLDITLLFYHLVCTTTPPLILYSINER